MTATRLKNYFFLLLPLFIFVIVIYLLSSPSYIFSATGDVVINEIAWDGTEADTNDEWIELYNTTGSPIDLTDWTLNATDGTPAITLAGTIPANGYFLLERTDDNTVKDITADQIYTGALGNGGESLELRDSSSTLIDSANSDGDVWPAGTSTPSNTMERVNPMLADSDDNWGTNDGVTINGTDAADGNILGTPKAENSVLQTASPTPSEEPTATPTEEVSPTPTGEVTETPTMTPTPSETASPTPTEEASPTPTEEVSPTPTEEVTPTPTAEPTPFPTPEPQIIGLFGFGRRLTVCRLEYRVGRFGFFKVFFPTVRCYHVTDLL